jgi:tetratricopeptide (TPR) repeat protein
MRLVLFLVLALAVSVALVAFPDVADQALRIEAFGWLFETRQGAFIVLLLVLMLLFWLLRSLFGALFAGPGTLWRSFNMGSHKRREKRLREELSLWLDQRGDLNAKTLKRSRGVLPGWALHALATLTTPAIDQSLAADDELITALAARIATDPGAHPRPDLATRKSHLEAWLHAHPGAPLALSRLADVAREEKDWPRLVTLLEDLWKRGHQPAHAMKPRLADAYLAMARQDPDHAMEYLRKAHRLIPEGRNVLLTYGAALAASGDMTAASRLWLGYLEKNCDFELARTLLDAVKDDSMRFYRKLERYKEKELNPAQRWLRAELAHAAKLDGLAFEYMQALASEASFPQIWQSLGDWHEAAGEHAQAALNYRQALKPGNLS